jgi:hypothetical protein
MLRRTGALAATLLVVVLAAGCSGGSKPTATATGGPRTFSPAPCPTSVIKPPAWPKQVPADFPKPPHAQLEPGGVTTTSDGVHITKFTTQASLRDGVLFVVDRLPKAGYALGRGDAEVTEADAPFVHGQTRGLVRMVAIAPCKTLWLLATVNSTSSNGGGTSPLLPTRSPSGSPSALPFG